MRIVQVIDSLEIGGAEKMAINYANVLSEKIAFSGLIATRTEGNLKAQISDNVSYLFLRKKSVIDLGAIFRLRNYCKQHNVEFIHAHGSSIYTVVLAKLIYPKIKIIRHDHNGMSEFTSTQRAPLVLKAASLFSKGIVVVNFKLKAWAEKELYCKKVIYLPNFTSMEADVKAETVLNGLDGKRILCVANLREQKNHFFLLAIAEKLRESHPEWTFHLVGKDFHDDYSAKLRAAVVAMKLQDHVFIYGSKNDVKNIINQSDITILTSISEGLPVSLIEYGLSKKPVVTTKVGEIPLIIKDNVNGFIVESNDLDAFYNSILRLIENNDLRSEMGNALYQTIQQNHSEDGVIANYLNWVAGL